MSAVEGLSAPDLVRDAERALQRGDPRGALALLRRAGDADPANAAVKLQTALALRMIGDLDGALAQLDEALAIDPWLLVAHLSKGFVLERLGLPRAAAAVYKVAVQCAPPDDQVPASLRAPLAKAREAVARHADDMAAHLKAATAPVRARFADQKLDRFDRALDIYVGKRRIYYPEGLLLNYPELPPIQFYDRELFPWLPELEAATDVIREELMVVLEEEWKEFHPYIAFPKGVPVNQWYELNHSPDWSGFFLWKDGARQDDHCARCPRTTALMERLPLANQPGFSPTVMFSVLQPHTTIPAHTGSSNIRLICHLPLILPGQCRFRVGNETREWKMGEAFVFDDTIEHEAWNDSDHVRVVLLIDVWNPYLSQAERELVSVMMTAKNAYMTSDGGR